MGSRLMTTHKEIYIKTLLFHRYVEVSENFILNMRTWVII